MAASPPSPPARLKLGRRDLLAAVCDQTGSKRADARKILDALLARMRHAIAEGRDLDLPPFGRLRQVRTTSAKDGTSSLVCRLRLDDPASSGSGGETLAEPSEDG